MLPGAVVSLTNTARAQEGVALLTRNTKLDQAAQMKASTMSFLGSLAGAGANVATGGGFGLAKSGFNAATGTLGPGKTSAAGIQGQYNRGF